MANTKITSNVISDDIALGGNPTTTTQSAGNNTTRIATTAFVKAAIDATIDSAPGALDTLNELAAAIGDDANFSTTITNSIATKAALAGASFTGNVTVPYLATTSYIDLNNSGNRGKIGWSGNHTYIATTSSVGSIIFKNNVGSTDAPQTGGDTLLTLADNGNATFAGTISSGAITSSGAISATEYDLPSGGYIDWDSGDARIIEGLVNNYSLSLQTYDGSNLTTALRLDGNNTATFAGSISSGAITSTGMVQGNSLKAHVGTDSGTQLTLFADASGHCFIAGHTLQFNVGANNGRATKFAINDSGNATFTGLVGVNKAVNTSVGLSVGADATSTTSYGLEVCNSSANTRFLVNGQGDSLFYKTDNSLGMKWDAVNGRLAVGQSSAPTEALEVNGSIVCSNFTDEEGIFFRSGFSNTNKYNVSIMAKDHNGSSADGLSINGYDGISFCTGSNSRNEVMRITGTTSNTGDVLIGTLVNPVGTGLAVNAAINSSSTTAIEIQQATDGANKAAAALGLAIQNGGQNTNAADLLFYTASGGSIAERVRITSAGTLAPRHASGQGYLSFTHVKGGGNYINVKTNIYRASKMYMLKILGHVSYSGERIDTIITGYAYAPNQGQTTSTYHGLTNHGTVGIAVYYSSDDYLCFRTTTSGSYNSIDIIGSSGATSYHQGGPIEILAYTSIAGTGNHYA